MNLVSLYTEERIPADHFLVFQTPFTPIHFAQTFSAAPQPTQEAPSGGPSSALFASKFLVSP